MVFRKFGFQNCEKVCLKILNLDSYFYIEVKVKALVDKRVNTKQKLLFGGKK